MKLKGSVLDGVMRNEKLRIFGGNGPFLEENRGKKRPFSSAKTQEFGPFVKLGVLDRMDNETLGQDIGKFGTEGVAKMGCFSRKKLANNQEFDQNGGGGCREGSYYEGSGDNISKHKIPGAVLADRPIQECLQPTYTKVNTVDTDGHEKCDLDINASDNVSVSDVVIDDKDHVIQKSDAQGDNCMQSHLDYNLSSARLRISDTDAYGNHNLCAPRSDSSHMVEHIVASKKENVIKIEAVKEKVKLYELCKNEKEKKAINNKENTIEVMDDEKLKLNEKENEKVAVSKEEKDVEKK